MHRLTLVVFVAVMTSPALVQGQSLLDRLARRTKLYESSTRRYQALGCGNCSFPAKPRALGRSISSHFNRTARSSRWARTAVGVRLSDFGRVLATGNFS